MTDARLSPTFLDHPVVDALDDRAHRVYTNGIVYCASHETDGFIPRRMLRLLYPEPIDLYAVANELIAVGLWQAVDDGWAIRNFLRYQTSRAQLDGKREYDRLRKQHERDAAKAGGSKSKKQPFTPREAPSSMRESLEESESESNVEGVRHRVVTLGAVTTDDLGQDRDSDRKGSVKGEVSFNSALNDHKCNGMLCAHPGCPHSAKTTSRRYENRVG